jgi:outer membrane receptor protein involved in Fe transport
MRAFLVSALLALSAPITFGQQAITAATVTGRVLDPNGAAVAGATVTAHHLDTAQVVTVYTGRDGVFRLNYLRAGAYRLEVVADGFAPSDLSATLSSGQAFSIAITLRLPRATEQVTVSAGNLLVETLRTQTSEVVTSHDVRTLPLNGRNYLDLSLLVPGVSRTNTGASQRFAETSAVPGTGISVSSQRNLNNTFLVDGLSANDDAAGLAGTFYGQEVVHEFQVVSAGGFAEFGRASGGVLNITTRSGGDRLHGDLYGYLRHQRFDAANPLSRSRLPLTQGQYGASLGGPLVRGRTFYFANFEQTRQHSAGVITITPAAISGINARLDAAAYPGPRIATGSFPASLDSTNFFAKLDHRTGAGGQLTLRYSLYDVASRNARNVGALNAVSRGAGLADRDQTLAASYVWTISPTLLSETRAQFTRSRLQAPVNDAIGPAVNIAGVAAFGTATFSPTARDLDLFETAQSLTWVRGKQTFKAGGDFLFDRVRIEFPGALQGVYSFSGLATFLAGNYTNFQQAFGETTTRQDNPNAGLFLQDQWRLLPNLTLQAGVRYELQWLPHPVQTDTDNLAPRIGLAWDPFGDGRTVVRAAYGLYFDRLPLRAVANALQRDGVRYRVALVTPSFPGAPVFPSALAAFPAGLLTNITSIDPHIPQSYAHQASLQVEHAFTPSLTVSLGYNHLRGLRLIMSRNINVPTTTDPSVFNLGRPDPSVANNGQYQGIGDSWYDGLTLMLNQRPARWAGLRVAYTWSKALDTAGNFFFSTPQDNFNIAAERGRSDNDQRHRLVVSGALHSPAEPAAGAWQRLWRGWSLSSIYSCSSALPFNIQTGNDRNGDTNANDRPAGVGRNTGIGFPFQSWDARLSRTLRLSERWRVEAMLEAFNLLNHRNDQLPNTIFGTGAYPVSPRPAFGRPTAVGDPRQLQLGLKVAF